MHYAELYITHGRKLYLLNELTMTLYVILNSSGLIFKWFYFTMEVVYWFKYSNSLFYQCKLEKTELMETILFFYFKLAVRTSNATMMFWFFFNMFLVCNEQLKFYHHGFYLDATILIVNLWLSRLDYTQIFELFLLGDFTNVRIDLSCSLHVNYIVNAFIYCFKSL